MSGDRWQPPRGRRAPDGKWRHTLRARPMNGVGIEQRAAMNFRDIVSTLEEARYELGLSLAEVARRAGLSKAAVADVESGRKWGSWPTLTRFAQVVEHRLTFDGNADVVAALVARTRPYSRERSPTATASACGLQPDTVRRLTETDAPHSATVLGLAAAFQTPIRVTPAAPWSV